MSILRQQRRLWFLAGAATGGLGLLTVEREAAAGVSHISAELPGGSARAQSSQEPAPIFGQQFFATAARKWNSGVDAVFRPIVRELSKRGL